MRWLWILLFGLIGCTTPHLGFTGAVEYPITVDDTDFKVFVKGSEAIAIPGETGTAHSMPLQGKARQAIERSTQCAVETLEKQGAAIYHANIHCPGPLPGIVRALN